MANSAKSIAVLSGHTPEVGFVNIVAVVWAWVVYPAILIGLSSPNAILLQICDTAFSFGRHLGLAFQIVDDILDLTASSTYLGKPALNDIKSGLATAPVLLAAEEHPELRPMILRRFKGSDDLAKAVALIQGSRGIERARELAQHHCFLAAEMVREMRVLPKSHSMAFHAHIHSCTSLLLLISAQIRGLPAAQSDHTKICQAALIKITDKVLNRRK